MVYRSRLERRRKRRGQTRLRARPQRPRAAAPCCHLAAAAGSAPGAARPLTAPGLRVPAPCSRLWPPRRAQFSPCLCFCAITKAHRPPGWENCPVPPLLPGAALLPPSPARRSQEPALPSPASPAFPTVPWHRSTATKEDLRYFCFVCKKELQCGCFERRFWHMKSLFCHVYQFQTRFSPSSNERKRLHLCIVSTALLSIKEGFCCQQKKCSLIKKGKAIFF